MIQKSIYFKHITEHWSCYLVNEYTSKAFKVKLFIIDFII